MKAQKRDKAPKKDTASWKKIVIVAACVIFVGMCIMSFANLDNLFTGNAPATTGEVAVLDYTLKDELGRPLVTSNQRLFNDTLKAGGFAMLSAQLPVTVNVTSAKPVSYVPVYISGVGQMNYGILGPEMNAISQALAGMKPGERKNISLPANLSMSTSLLPDEFESVSGMNISGIKLGDQIPLRLTTQSPQDMTNNTTSLNDYFLRIAHVTQLDDTGVVLEYNLTSADITVSRMNR